MKYAVPCQLTGVKSRADRSWKLEFNTAELGGDAAQLTELLMSQGWLVFSPNDDIEEQDIPEVRADPNLNEKSPSQRLRDTLFVYWAQKGKPGTWETFYTTQMANLTGMIQAKLEPND